MKNRNMRQFLIIFSLAALMCTACPAAGQEPGRDVRLTVHLRGVFESKISILGLTPANTMQAFLVQEGVKNGHVAEFIIPGEKLPGEFVIRFDYKEKESSNPYPSEKEMIINDQDLVLQVHPMFANNPDSTRFQDDERENAAYVRFMIENARQKEMLGLLQNFLLNYDDDQSAFYHEAIREYEHRRERHNSWIAGEISSAKPLFAATLFGFQYVPDIAWAGDNKARAQSLADHYFDYLDLGDPWLIRVRDFKSWMDQYVNIYGEQVTTVGLRDSLFTLAGRNAIEKARKGNPLVCGWMVDYFYRGYESFNIQDGIAMLEPYLDDPGCLTQKQQAIQKRIEGMKTIVPGSVAPDFSYKDDFGMNRDFHTAHPGTPYKLVLFWSADCPHCMELVYKLHAWHQQPGHRDRVTVYAISLDETETEVAEYEKLKPALPGWVHLLAEGGVNSAEANNYYILATPVMVLVNSRDNTVVDLPAGVQQLEALIR